MKKGLALVLALTLLVVGAVAGTLAWLTDKTDAVVNTFTTSGIDIGLKEEAGTNNTTGGKDFKMIPGHTITKNPVTWVEKGSEDCYLFVKLDKSANFDTYLKYEMASGWQQLKDKDGNNVEGVYYREVAATTTAKSDEFQIIKDNKVTVDGDAVTSAVMKQFENATLAKPTLTITAYASQLYKEAGVKFKPYEAWDNVYTPPSGN